MEDILIRSFRNTDQNDVLALWKECNLTVPWNDPVKDIQRKMNQNPEQFLVVERDRRIIATCMSGYDGHRGWIYYLGVAPQFQRMGIACLDGSRGGSCPCSRTEDSCF